MPRLNRIDAKRGLKGAGMAGAIGLAVGALAAVATPLGWWLCPAICSMCACAGWVTYAPDGNHRFTAALAGLFGISFMAMDLAAVGRPGDSYYTTFVVVAMQIGVTLILTAMRAVRM